MYRCPSPFLTVFPAKKSPAAPVQEVNIPTNAVPISITKSVIAKVITNSPLQNFINYVENARLSNFQTEAE